MRQCFALKNNGLCAYVQAFAAYVGACVETYVEIWAKSRAGAYVAYWRDYVETFKRAYAEACTEACGYQCHLIKVSARSTHMKSVAVLRKTAASEKM